MTRDYIPMNKHTRTLIDKFYINSDNYNFTNYRNPFGLITFKNKDNSIYAQFYHNTDFQKWFKYFVKQWNIKEIISVTKTKFNTLIVEVK